MASSMEGISLLSMYSDEEEEGEGEEEPVPEPEPEEEHRRSHEQEKEQVVSKQGEDKEGEEVEEGQVLSDSGASPRETPPPSKASPYASGPKVNPNKPAESPMVVDHSPSPLRPRPPTPLVTTISASPAVDAPEAAAVPRRKVGAAVSIVDYAHDENAFSPDAEEREMVADLDTLDAELLETDGSYEDRCSPGAAQVLSPSTEATLQSYEQPEASKFQISVEDDAAGKEMDPFQLDKKLDAVVEMQEHLDPLKKFLPPPPTTRCPQELQEKISKFLALKRAGKSFNTELRSMKAYRNPDFLQHAVRYQEINQMGTCFCKDVFDPVGYDKSDYYDEIEADMKRDLERKEQERKRSPKVEFVPGGVSTGMVPSASKISAQLSVSGSAIISTLQTTVSVPADASSKEGRQSKKSKWDKSDMDPDNSLHSGGSNNMPPIAHYTSIVSAAKIGTGYSAFVQQKRREAEEKQSSERKYDKRT